METRNPYLETPDQGVYPNTTATTTMDIEDAAYQNRRKCLDSSGYGEDSGQLDGSQDKSTDDDQTRVYTVKTGDKLVSIPAIRIAPVSPD